MTDDDSWKYKFAIFIIILAIILGMVYASMHSAGSSIKTDGGMYKHNLPSIESY
jgi:membrane-anchored protein YejM (alkaline phosphatase superfamily)